MPIKAPITPETTTHAAEVKVQEAPKHSKKVIVLLLLLSLVLALSTVMLVPLFVDGAETIGSSSTATTASLAPPAPIQDFETLADASSVLGFTPHVPNAIPNGYQLHAIRALDGGILELEYISSQDVLLFRTAPGAEDLSLTDTHEYSFTLSDEDDAAVRTFMGDSTEKLFVAVWAQEDASYAVLSESGLNEQDMLNLTHSIS